MTINVENVKAIAIEIVIAKVISYVIQDLHQRVYRDVLVKVETTMLVQKIFVMTLMTHPQLLPLVHHLSMVVFAVENSRSHSHTKDQMHVILHSLVKSVKEPVHLIQIVTIV